LGWHPLAVVQYTFTHRQYIEQHKMQYIEQHKNKEQHKYIYIYKNNTNIYIYIYIYIYILVGKTTRYGLDGPGIEFRCGRVLPYTSRPFLGRTQPPMQWVEDLSQGWSGRGVGLTTHPHLNVEVKEREKLCLYPLLGLHGLF
jgi:hypothetical protein